MTSLLRRFAHYAHYSSRDLAHRLAIGIWDKSQAGFQRESHLILIVQLNNKFGFITIVCYSITYQMNLSYKQRSM